MKPLIIMLLFLGVACGAGETIPSADGSPEMTSAGEAESTPSDPPASASTPATTTASVSATNPGEEPRSESSQVEQDSPLGDRAPESSDEDAAPSRSFVLCPQGEYAGTFRSGWVFIEDVPVAMNLSVEGDKCVVRVSGVFDEAVVASDLSTWSPDDSGLDTTASTEVNLYQTCVNRQDPSVSYELNQCQEGGVGMLSQWCTPAEFGISNSNTRVFIGVETIEVRIRGSVSPAYGPAFDSTPRYEPQLDPDTGLPVSHSGVRLGIEYPCDPALMDSHQFEKYSLTTDAILG